MLTTYNCLVRQLVLAGLAGTALTSSIEGVAGSLLVSQHSGYYTGYGDPSWVTMSGLLDNATGGNVTLLPDFMDNSQVQASDALWLDQRLGGSLAPQEINNIQSFIATGKRVVLVGENSNWQAWDQQILGIVGGSYASDTGWVLANTVFSHPLTAGVSTVYLIAAGVAAPSAVGTPLFDINTMTLWGPEMNVLSMLESNTVDDNYIGYNDNLTFARNLADWVAAPRVSVPEGQGGEAMLAFLGLLGFAAYRRAQTRHSPI